MSWLSQSYATHVKGGAAKGIKYNLGQCLHFWTDCSPVMYSVAFKIEANLIRWFSDRKYILYFHFQLKYPIVLPKVECTSQRKTNWLWLDRDVIHTANVIIGIAINYILNNLSLLALIWMISPTCRFSNGLWYTGLKCSNMSKSQINR